MKIITNEESTYGKIPVYLMEQYCFNIGYNVDENNYKNIHLWQRNGRSKLGEFLEELKSTDKRKYIMLYLFQYYENNN